MWSSQCCSPSSWSTKEQTPFEGLGKAGRLATATVTAPPWPPSISAPCLSVWDTKREYYAFVALRPRNPTRPAHVELLRAPVARFSALLTRAMYLFHSRVKSHVFAGVHLFSVALSS